MHTARNGKKDIYIELEKLIRIKDWADIQLQVQEFKNESNMVRSSSAGKAEKAIHDKQTNNVINEISRRLNKEGKRIRAVNRKYPHIYPLDSIPIP